MNITLLKNWTLDKCQQTIAEFNVQKSQLQLKKEGLTAKKNEFQIQKKKIREDKTKEGEKIQNEINRLNQKSAKDYKRKMKKSSGSTFDTRIISKQREIDSINREITNVITEIANLNLQIAKVKSGLSVLKSIERSKPKMMNYLRNNSYSQFSESLLSIVYPKLTHHQKIKYMEFIADTLTKLNNSQPGVMQQLNLSNIDLMLKMFYTKFEDFPDR